MKELYRVERIGNEFIVGRSKSYHYYIALMLGGERAHAWRRVTKNYIEKNYRKVD